MESAVPYSYNNNKKLKQKWWSTWSLRSWVPSLPTKCRCKLKHWTKLFWSWISSIRPSWTQNLRSRSLISCSKRWSQAPSRRWRRRTSLSCSATPSSGSRRDSPTSHTESTSYNNNHHINESIGSYFSQRSSGVSIKKTKNEWITSLISLIVCL